MRIPIWPGVRLSVWEPQNPEAVQIVMACYYKPFKVTRILSKRGWAIFLTRYDWRDRGTYEPGQHAGYDVIRARADQAEAIIARIEDELARLQGAYTNAHGQPLSARDQGVTTAVDRIRRALAPPRA